MKKKPNEHRRAPIALMACNSGRKFAHSVASEMGIDLLTTKETWFACGEGKFEIKSNVRGHDVYIFQSAVGKQDGRSVYDRFLMLLHAVEAAALSDAQYITAVLPYYPGARQDKRKGRSREGISAGLFARLLQSAGVSRVMSVEIHNDSIAGMFNPSLAHLENVFLTNHFSKWIKSNHKSFDVVVSPDVGYLERARAFSEELSADLAALSKERDYSKANSIFTSNLIGEVKGRDVLLVDDIVDTGGSVVSSIQELKKQGAKNITIACVHPLMNGDCWKKLELIYKKSVSEGWHFNMTGTSVVEHKDSPAWYTTYKIEKLIARVLEKINSRGSVTSVQDNSSLSSNS